MNAEHRNIIPSSKTSASGWSLFDKPTYTTQSWRLVFSGLCFRREDLDVSDIFYREKLALTSRHLLYLTSHVLCFLVVIAAFLAPYWVNMSFVELDEQLHVGVMMKCYVDIGNRRVINVEPGCTFIWLNGFQGKLPYWLNLARYEVMAAVYLLVVTLLIDVVVLLRRTDFRWLAVPGVLSLHAGLLMLAAVGIVVNKLNNYDFIEFKSTPVVMRSWALYLAGVAGIMTVLSSLLTFFVSKGKAKTTGRETITVDPPVYEESPSYIPYYHI